MKLTDLINVLRPETVNGLTVNHGQEIIRQDFGLDEDIDLSSVHYRSKEVQPGSVFVAMKGQTADGHEYIDEAVDNGAVVIVTQKALQHEATVVQVENSRLALSRLSAHFYGNPSEKLTVIGITGTNGKTTTAYLIESVLLCAGIPTGVIGTINYRYNNQVFNNPVTTPESLELHAILAEMLSDGITHVILEVSSHAIDLFRVHECRFDIGIFTNLTQDHLDYHGDMTAYWACKKKFFTDILAFGPKKEHAAAVINCSNAEGRELADELQMQKITIGHGVNYMIRPLSEDFGPTGISAILATPDGEIEIESALSGKHNLENILATVGAGYILKIPGHTIQSGIRSLTRVPGRLESIPNEIDRHIFVDYAHTPDALENALSALLPITQGRMICIFGCGGDRDKEKRPRMGIIAATLCDLTIVTSDNPRTESPAAIIQGIMAGIKRTSAVEFAPDDMNADFTPGGFWVEPDRRKAIRLAVLVSRPGDTILIAGKGHETYQIVGKEMLSFDDRVEARAALSELAQQDHPTPVGLNG